jgi:hypothetical protein
MAGKYAKIPPQATTKTATPENEKKPPSPHIDMVRRGTLAAPLYNLQKR